MRFPYKIISFFLIISCYSFGASFPSNGYTSENEDAEEIQNIQNNEILKAAYANYDPTDPLNQVDLNGGSAPDPILTNHGAAFSAGDSVQIQQTSSPYSWIWYKLNWSSTWSGYLGLVDPSNDNPVGGVAGAFLGLDVPLDNEQYALLSIIALYIGLKLWRRQRKISLTKN